MRKMFRTMALALAAALLLAGCSLPGMGPKTSGKLGDELETMFFDFAVDQASSPADYAGYTPAEGNRLVVCTVRVKNTFGETLPMYDTDFQLQWGSGEEDWAWALDAFTDEMMPLEWDLLIDDEMSYEMLFEVPADVDRFMLVYLEQYVDGDGNEGEGDLFSVNFSV